MKSIVEKALEYERDDAQRDKSPRIIHKTEALLAKPPVRSTVDEEARKHVSAPRILVVGCGGAGNNSVNRLMSNGIHGAKTIAVNTDIQHFEIIDADQKILIGTHITKGLGAGGDPALAERAADESRQALQDSLRGADLVFVTAGMGGGTGTGTAPVVAKIAKDMDAIVVSIVTTPFVVERARLLKAFDGLKRLREHSHSMIVLDNNRLLKICPNQPINEAFRTMDSLIAEIVQGITETITLPSLINLDYADVRTIMKQGGIAMMLYGETENSDPEEVVSRTLHNQLLNVKYKGASAALIHITGGEGLSLRTANAVANGITRELNQNANIILGARVNPDFGSRIKVMTIITGVNSPSIPGGGEISAGQHPMNTVGGSRPHMNPAQTSIPWVR